MNAAAQTATNTYSFVVTVKFLKIDTSNIPVNRFMGCCFLRNVSKLLQRLAHDLCLAKEANWFLVSERHE